MTTKLKIDLSTGLLEVEGTEEFVKTIYDDFKEKLNSPTPAAPAPESKPAAATTPAKKAKPKKAAASAGNASKAKKAPGIAKDLDLSGGADDPTLKEFYGRYDHKSNFERNLIFTYYLKQVIGVEKVNLDHIFTCYRNVGQKLPKALEQSMRDTAKDKGWVDIDDLENIDVPVGGINHLEHDLAKAE
ncbi:MAG: hypothetical protein K1564_09145 [Candidatus Thiodiazotropha sp. (ex. Lucinisca nassula)]|nr:hypothetical protein [Candidatus Thiodiazotropha sp. (ex. Lucinisca nassula)]